jgi:hypothetical protein
MPTARRVREFDATRGVAMLLVCLSHSVYYLDPDLRASLGTGLITLGMVATPTFLLLSGLVCGYLSTLHREAINRLRWRLFDRGIFLVVVVHVLLGLIHATWAPAAAAIFDSFYITDAVGVGLIVAALVAQRVRPRSLTLISLALLVVAWIVANLPVPSEPAERFLVRLLFGSYSADAWDEGYVVPLVPYVSIFLLGNAAGIDYGSRPGRGRAPDLSSYWIRLGSACIGVAVVVKLVWLLAKPHVPPEWQLLFYHLTEPRQKLPPGPAYLLAYGGASAVLAGLIARLALKEWGVGLVRVFAVVGRASLFVFVLQYLLIYFPPRALHIGQGAWLYALPASLVVLWVSARVWDTFEGNRLFTVGLKNLGGVRPAQVHAACTPTTRAHVQSG